MIARVTAAVAVSVLLAAIGPDPLAFFRPDVATTEAEWRRLDRGDPIAHALPAHDAEIAVFAAVPVAVDADRFVAWIRRVDALKRSSYVPAIHRFSNPPALADLAELMLDADDLDAIGRCRPNDCDVKLSSDEIASIRAVPANERQDAFRRVLLARVNHYLAAGDSNEAVARIVHHLVFLTRGLPALTAELASPPRSATTGESFLYWSKERLANRPIVIVTDVRIVRSDEPSRPAALVAGKQIFWTRYLSAAIGVTALMRGRPNGPNYLVYVNRSDVDVVHGMFGGLIRWVAQRRVADEAADVLRGLRTRLESGDPPPPR